MRCTAKNGPTVLPILLADAVLHGGVKLAFVYTLQSVIDALPLDNIVVKLPLVARSIGPSIGTLTLFHTDDVLTWRDGSSLCSIT